MGPKATLIGDPWITRTMVFGKRRLIFKGGEPREVPVSVAMVLKKRLGESGKPIFKIEDLPVIVKATHPPINNPIPPLKAENRNPRQRKLAECRL